MSDALSFIIILLKPPPPPPPLKWVSMRAEEESGIISYLFKKCYEFRSLLLQ